MWIPFLALIRKDLKLFLADRRAILMSVAAPIAIGSFFGYIFGGGAGQTETSRIAVLTVDQDGSAISREIVSRLTADKSLEVKSSGPAQARDAVRKGRAALAFLIPKDFGADAGRAFFSGSQKPEIGVLYDPSHATEMNMAQGILMGHVMEAVSKEMFSGASGRQVVQESLAQLNTSGLPADQKSKLRDLLRGVQGWNADQDARKGAVQQAPRQGLSLPYQVRSEAVTSGTGIRYNGYAHSFGGMGIQFILFVGIEVGIGLLLQRQRGVWKRLRAAPISRGVLLGSRAASAAITSLFILLVLFGFARVVFGVHIQGSLAGFLGVCAAFSLMTAAFGLLVAAIGKTPEATRGLAIFATLLMVMLGGAWVPTFIFPKWLQSLTVVIPTRWAMDGLDAMTWRGLDFSAAVTPIVLLLGFSLLCGALAVSRFRWEADG